MEVKAEHLKQLQATLHENYNIDLKSITSINNYLLDIEKAMDSVGTKLETSLMDKDIKRFFAEQFKRADQQRAEHEAEKRNFEKEVKQLKNACDAYEAKKNQVVAILQQISENFENNLVGYLGTIIQEVFCGRPEAQTPLATM